MLSNFGSEIFTFGVTLSFEGCPTSMISFLRSIVFSLDLMICTLKTVHIIIIMSFYTIPIPGFGASSRHRCPLPPDSPSPPDHRSFIYHLKISPPELLDPLQVSSEFDSKEFANLNSGHGWQGSPMYQTVSTTIYCEGQVRSGGVIGYHRSFFISLPAMAVHVSNFSRNTIYIPSGAGWG